MTTPYLTPPVFSWPAAPGGKLHTYLAGGTTPQVTYSDAAGVTSNANPVTLDTLGSAVVRLAVGVAYHVVLKDPTDVTTIWDADNIDNAYLSSSSLTGAVIGAALYPRTAAEITAGVTPTNYAYETTPLTVLLRYGGDPTGIADSRSAFNTASLVGQPFTVPPGTYLVNSNVTITPNIVFQPGAILKPANLVTITLTGTFQAGEYQIFDYSLGGFVALNNTMTIVRATWWGAQAYPSAKVNNEVPFNQAWMSLLPVVSGYGNIMIPRGFWYKSGSSYHSSNISFIGEGSLSSSVFANAATWPSGTDNGSNLFRSQHADPVFFTVAPIAGATTGTINPGYGGATNTAPVVPANLAIVFFQRNGAACEIHRIASIHNGDVTITWAGGLAADCAFYAVVLSEVAIFGNRLEHLRLNGGNLAGGNLPRLVYAPAWQQQSGAYDLYFDGYNGDGIFIDQGYGGAATIRMRQLEFAPQGNNVPGSAGIRISLPNYSVGYYGVDLEEVHAPGSGLTVTFANPIAQPLTFTAPPAAAATSATLNAVWTGTTGAYLVFFVETAGSVNEVRSVTLTNGATTATWTGGLAANCNALTQASNNAAAAVVLAAPWANANGVWLVQFIEDGTGGGVAGNPRPRMVTLTNGASTATWQGDLLHTSNAAGTGITPNCSLVSANGNIILNCDDVHTEATQNGFTLDGNAIVTGSNLTCGGTANIGQFFHCNTTWTGYIKASGVVPANVLALIFPDSSRFYAQCGFLPPDGELVWPPVPTRPIAAACVTGSAAPVLSNNSNMLSVTHIGTGQQRLTVGPALWNAATLYYPGNSVQIAGSFAYICIASNINKSPPNVTYWTQSQDGPSTIDIAATSGDSAAPMISYGKNSGFNFDVFTKTGANVAADAAEFTVKVYHR